MYSVHIIPSRVLLPRDSAIFADLICRIPLQCCFRWLCLVVGLFGHLCAQYISVPLFYIVYTVHRCVFVLYRLWLLFLLAVYRMSVQSILIAYFYRCVQCTRYYCQCIYIYSWKWAFCDCYLYHLSPFTFSKCAVSVS